MSASRLKNEFSWSFSRHNTFAECEKKYWYTYYGSWEGWPLFRNDPRRELDPLAAYLYAMKQMQHMPMFVGTVVHSAIENGLRQKQKYRKEITLASLLEEAFATLDRGISDSEQEKWRHSPKRHANLFEIYHSRRGEGEVLSEEAVQRAREKIRRCLENWFHSPIHTQLIAAPKAHWVSIEELDHFYLDGLYKIYVVIDFSMKWQLAGGQVATLLFDWKTGKETDKTIDQLYSYAIYAKEVWGVDYGQVVLTPYYLDSNRYEKIGWKGDVPLSTEKVAEVEQFMRQSAQKMVGKILPSVDGSSEEGKRAIKEMDNSCEPEQFAYTERRGQCQRCPFQHLCQAADYQQKSRQELRALVDSKGVN